MGGGKRGRTQRRHFKQGRENVWKHNNKKTRSDGDPSSDPNPTDPSWQPFATQNPGFEEYYKGQGIVSDEEWEEFLGFLRKPLPAAFRINSSGQFFQDIRSQLENDFMKSLEAEINNNDNEIEAIRPLPWYPENLAWHLNFSRMQLRKNQTLERFHEFLKQENEIGNITRQEAVSMVPPLFLDVLPDHHVLDMCAAPGSKTFQLLEIIHQSTKPGSLPKGMVIANDVDVQRCNLLIHQTKRMCTANLIVTNHEAQHFPCCYLARDHIETSKEVQEESQKDVLQFDRVLCDVPCSGDGTLRKAPDIWRKWNSGMGNGVHRLQVEIAMRGIALLKVGGRMVYSTCSMNPVENEAVVAEVLRRCEGSVELLDVSNELPALVRRPGLKKWKVRDKGIWLASYEDCPMYRRNVIVPSMFTSEQSCMDSHILNDAAQEVIETNGSEIREEGINSIRMKDREVSTVEQESNSDMMENNATPADVEESPCKKDEISSKSASKEDLVVGFKMETSTFPLERCMRLLPHDQNTGAFFVAVLLKLSHMSDNRISRLNNGTNKTPVKEVENLEDEQKSKIKSSEDVPHQDHHSLPEAASFTNLISEQSLAMKTENADTEEAETCNNEESGHAEIKGAKGRLQLEGKWKGIDPVVFFRDETAINSIRSFYGISESFPLDGYLVARNSDTSHVKRIYYVSRSVHDVLQLNFQVGQRLKITSLGLKIFERQTSKDGSQCAFRVSSEGLPLLLPYMSKQVLCASLVDFQHLLQYRVIKFADFVDANFGEKVSGLMPGCCVVVLNEDSIVVDASAAIAIICWKGKTNLSIMVSQMDAQELLARLSARFGSGKVADAKNELEEIELVKGSDHNTEDEIIE